jgi:hypothetical protein
MTKLLLEAADHLAAVLQRVSLLDDQFESERNNGHEVIDLTSSSVYRERRGHAIVNTKIPGTEWAV